MRRRRRAREGQEKRERENRRSILKKLCAAILRSFRGQHSEKMQGSTRGNWDPREVQQPFRPNPNGVGDRIITLRRLLIGADEDLRYINLGNTQYLSWLFFYHLHSYDVKRVLAVLDNKTVVWLLDSCADI